MRAVTVYRVDYIRKTKIPVGWVLERRKKDRGYNHRGLLRMAREMYSSPMEEGSYITIDGENVRAVNALPCGEAGGR